MSLPSEKEEKENLSVCVIHDDVEIFLDYREVGKIHDPENRPNYHQQVYIT